MKTAVLVLSTVFTVPALAAGFEGTIDMKMTSKMAQGEMRISVGKTGVRNDMKIMTPQMPMTMTVIFQKSTPDVAYLINDAQKTFSEIDLKESRALDTNARKFTAKKLGKEKVNGWDTVHAIVTDDRGNTTEVWTNNEILDWKSFVSMMSRGAPADENMMKALQGVGAGGFIVKLVAKPKDAPNEATTMELVKADKKSMPASLFEIPKGYKKNEDPAFGATELSPEMKQQLMEKMKNLTPEQQEQIRKALQQQR